MTMTKEDLFYSSTQLKMNEIVIEPFVFKVGKFDGLAKYRIGIGADCVDTCMSDYDNDLDYIRLCLEHAAMYPGSWDSKIGLCWDMSPNTIHLRRSIAFDFDKIPAPVDIMRVEIVMNEFQDDKKIIGFCDIKQVISTLYSGLLQLAYSFPYDNMADWDYSTLVAYNTFKSHIVEDFLSDKEKRNDEVQIRQTIVKHILTIEPDVDQIFLDEDGVTLYADGDGTLEEVYDKNGSQIVLKELVEWADEIYPIVVAAATGKSYSKDWSDYHQRGLALAHQLREMLSPDFDLWYSAPFEDKSGTIPEPILIIKGE